MNYFKKVIDWVCKQYDIFFDKKPKKKVYTIKGKKYVLKKRIKNASNK
jgi:hypothetical protein